MHRLNSREWNVYYECLNAEKPVEECPLDLDDEGKKAYNKELEFLKSERAKHPDVPIGYETTFELDWE